MLDRRTAYQIAATLIGVLISLACARAALAQRAAEPLSASDRGCVIASNKIAVRMYTAQGKLDQSCFKQAGKGGTEVSFAECSQADEGSKVAKLSTKLGKSQGKKCSLPHPPYGFADVDTVVGAVVTAEQAVMEGIFGSPVDAGVVLREEDFDGVKCQIALLRASQRYASVRMKEFKNCKKGGLKAGTIIDQMTMADCIVADPREKVAAARADITEDVEDRCDSGKLAALFPGECATSSASAAEFGGCVSRHLDCKTCILANDMDGLLFDCDTLDDGIQNASCRTCGNSVVEFPEICDHGGPTSTCDVDCTLPACGDGVLNTPTGEECDDGNGIDGDGCDDGCILSACGNGVLGGVDEQCDDGNNVAGDGCDDQCQCEPGAFLSGCHDPLCPDTGEFIQMAATGRVCTTNADCPAGACDPLIARCRTPTTDDFGYSGIVHDVDSNEASVTRLALTCPGPGPVCGDCIVDGIDPRPRNCRCANDNQKICDAPLRPDADDCGGAMCECYEGPPSPNSAGNTPVCTVYRHAEDVFGTVNVDTGEGVVTKTLRAVVHFGEHLIDPCPRCQGDVTNDDGVRHGTCMNGPNAGQACDVNAIHTSFPAPGGGGGHSLDCMPSPAKNISATGVLMRAAMTTGTSTLEADVPCGQVGSGDLCPCGVCSLDPTIGCGSDADCVGVGTCGRVSDGIPARNDCFDGVCADVGGQEGKCFANELSYCDGVLRADGRPIVSCNTDGDCDSSDCGAGVSCGACTLVDPLACFLDDVITVGQADPLRPVRGASYCIPPSTAGVNIVLGLPGPGRIVRQEVARYLCADEGISYTPGVGGCP